jgi:hypothetical protein
MRRHPEDVNPASLDLHNKEHLDAPQQHRVDVEEVARQRPLAWAPRNLCQLMFANLGAGPGPALARMRRTVPSPTL